MLLRKYKTVSTSSKTRLCRVVMGIVLFFLALQLLSPAHHDHAYADTKADCASCFFAHHLPSDLPPVAPVPVPVLALASYPLPAVILQRHASRTSYLIPHAQAPPAAAL